jgi:hypothetical protein
MSTDPLKTDKTVYPEPPPPALPQAGGAFTDPTFGTTLLRVTDERDGADNKNAYSYWPSLNCNNTRLFYMSGMGNTAMVCDFDPVGFKVANKRPLWAAPVPGGGLLNTEDAIWSGVDPDVIFGHLGMKVWAYNVRVGTYSLVVDLTGKAGNAVNLQQMTKTADDNGFAFNVTLGESGGWKRSGCAAWRKRENDLYVQMIVADDLTTAVDEVHIDKSGKFLMQFTGIQGPTAIEARVIDLTTKQVTNITDSGPDYCPSHHDIGRDFVVGADNWNNSITARKLSAPHQFQTILSFGNDWSQSNHISLLADDEGWALVGLFLVNNSAPAGVFRNELILVATDGSQRVRRVCHHHSNYATTREYWNSPRPDLSKDGQFTVFTSPWGSTTRRDVFVVRIPPATQPAPPPTVGLSAKLRQLADDYDAGRLK